MLSSFKGGGSGSGGGGGGGDSLQWPVKMSLYIGIPSLAALVAYLLQRIKTQQTEEEQLNAESRAYKSESTSVEVKVPANCVRSIIGQQGCVIKELQRRTNTRINFKDKPPRADEHTSGEGSAECVVLIRGQSMDVARAEIEIKRIIVDTPHALTEEYWVPEYACGRIIGRGGVSIKEMSNMCGCVIKLVDVVGGRGKNGGGVIKTDAAAISTEFMKIMGNGAALPPALKKIIRLTGSNEQIANAKELIVTKIREEEMLHEKRMKRNTSSSGKLSHSRSNGMNTRTNTRYDYDHDYDHEENYDAENAKTTTSQPITTTTATSNVTVAQHDGEENQRDNNNNNNNNNNNKCTTTAEVDASTVSIAQPINIETYLNAGGFVDVYISAIADPCAFWVQVCSETRYLDRLVSDMSDFYGQHGVSAGDQTSKHAFTSVDDVKVGTIVACRYNTSSDWHRAEVKEIRKGGEGESGEPYLDIYYIDYGESAFAKLASVRRLEARFMSLPPQAIECALANCESTMSGAPTSWSEEAVVFFERATHSCRWIEMRLEFCGLVANVYDPSTLKPAVNLFDKTLNMGVTDMLVEKGFASLKPTATATATATTTSETTSDTSQQQEQQEQQQPQEKQEQEQEQQANEA